ncbi:DNA polymerase III subunit gamma/tau [Desulforhopalus vacuolatus]|uniref:DNA polymerase III subunit gamma/tau n=1 Tax=Desulforhopalus vacuolatus TaxID=40414 RepID=UPI001963DC5C|nr:DNA polymerase III subunit gamma/tau [Desulforhopalus vacuolatus]MBM9520026.1 DNA polymerase III subunit gamma/tau [Desulforhopalus vacuolatus]
MSYLVLARKSRPQNFDEVIGQKPIVKTLKNSIVRERIAHAILFSGVRGVGKTTLARIMAMAINCEAPPAERPCNKCRSCLDIAAGRSLDIEEIDGASNNGVDNVRELREKVKIMPTSSRCKVVIIDEVHMLSISAFNALLKTLEEPPEHVYFIFATTEIHKVPVTILSRCQQYELKKISELELIAHFKKLVEGEGFTVEESALSLVARESGGSVRDGLSLLDQMFSFGEKNITSTDVVEMLGLVGREVLMKLTRALLDGQRQTVFATLNEVFDFGGDLKRFMEDLLGNFRTLLLLSMHGCEKLVELSEAEFDEFSELARRFSMESIHLKLTQLMNTAESLQYAAQPRLTLETSLLKVIEAGNVMPLSAVLGQMNRILPQLKELGELKAQAVVSTTPARPQSRGEENTPGKKPEPPVAEVSEIDQPAPVCEELPLPPQPEKLHEPKLTPAATPPPPHQAPPAPQALFSSDTSSFANCAAIKEKWPEYIAHVESEVEWMAAVLQDALEVTVEDGDPCRIEVYYDDETSCSMLRQPAHLQILERHALDFFGRAITISLTAAVEDKSDENSPRAMRKRLANDPKVRLTAEVFLGQVGEVRVRSKAMQKKN